MTTQLFLVREHYELSSFGVNSRDILATSVINGSAPSICVQLVSPYDDDLNDISIFDVPIGDDAQPCSKKCRKRGTFFADQAAVSPNGEIIALLKDAKIGREIQFFNMESEHALSVKQSCDIGEKVSFMKWISPTTLGLVTKRAVYHVSASDTQNLTRTVVFIRPNDDTNFDTHKIEITDYLTDSSERWGLLVGGRVGCSPERVQLFEGGRHLLTLHGQVGTFFKLEKLQFLAIASRNHANGHQGNLCEIQLAGWKMLIEEKASSPIQFGNRTNDMPIAVKFSYNFNFFAKFNWLCVLSKCGFFYLFAAETAQLLHYGSLSDSIEPIVFTRVHNLTQGRLLCIDRHGRLFSMGIIDGDDNGDDDNNNNNFENNNQLINQQQGQKRRRRSTIVKTPEFPTVKSPVPPLAESDENLENKTSASLPPLDGEVPPIVKTPQPPPTEAIEAI